MKKALLALALLFWACCPLKKPETPAPVRLHSTKVWIDDSVRERLRKDWDAVNPDQLERKYCMAYTILLEDNGDSAFTISAALPAFEVTAATPASIDAKCPLDIPTKDVASYIHFTDVHIHPPTTCDKENGKYVNCRLGGRYAFECYPSTADWDYLLTVTKFKFALIQCGPDAIVPYFVNPYWWK